ncbi:hypothetical protein ACJBU6_02854 [Exserohilum turcicum]
MPQLTHSLLYHSPSHPLTLCGITPTPTPPHALAVGAEKCSPLVLVPSISRSPCSAGKKGDAALGRHPPPARCPLPAPSRLPLLLPRHQQRHHVAHVAAVVRRLHSTINTRRYMPSLPPAPRHQA